MSLASLTHTSYNHIPIQWHDLVDCRVEVVIQLHTPQDLFSAEETLAKFPSAAKNFVLKAQPNLGHILTDLPTVKHLMIVEVMRVFNPERGMC